MNDIGDTIAPAKMGTFTDKDVLDMLDRVAAEKDRRGITWPTVAVEMGLAEGTFSSFRSVFPKGTYQGDVQKVADAMSKWLEHVQERRTVARKLARTPGFVNTPTFKSVELSLAYAHLTPAITTYIGVPGIGKTMAAEKYRAEHPNVHLATMEPMTRGAGAMLMEIALEIGITEKCQTKLPRVIGKALKGANALLILDEAQHLELPALDQLRSLYDKWGVGIALVGNETLAATIDGKRDTATAQIRSRMGMRRIRKSLENGDACALIEAWGVNDKDTVNALKRIAAKPGALRNIMQVMIQAHLAVEGGADEIDAKLVNAIWANLKPEGSAS